MLNNCASMLIDFHAHLSRREVIGLLGGHYDLNLRVLKIVAAEPCRSLSTGLQCEMDPGKFSRVRFYIY